MPSTQVLLRVAPLTRRVLLAEYGHSTPIVPCGKDIISRVLASTSPMNAHTKAGIPFLSATIEVIVPDEVARTIFTHPYHAGALLYQMHKEQMCRHAFARVRSGAEAWASIQEWLHLHDVDEDEYGMDAAYKCWQRWLAKKRAHNAELFSRIAPKGSAKPAKKTARHATLTMRGSQIDIELAASRFYAIIRQRMKHVPARLPSHARAYLYKSIGGLSERRIEQLTGIPRASVGYACRTMQAWLDTNAIVRQALAESAGLPVHTL